MKIWPSEKCSDIALIWCDKYLHIYWTFIYHFINMFHYFVNLRLWYTHFKHQNNFSTWVKVCFHKRYEEFIKSDFSFSALGPNYLFTQCSRLNGASLQRKLRLFLMFWYQHIGIMYASVFKGEFKKICKHQEKPFFLFKS